MALLLLACSISNVDGSGGVAPTQQDAQAFVDDMLASPTRGLWAQLKDSNTTGDGGTFLERSLLLLFGTSSLNVSPRRLSLSLVFKRWHLRQPWVRC